MTTFDYMDQYTLMRFHLKIQTFLDMFSAPSVCTNTFDSNTLSAFIENASNWKGCWKWGRMKMRHRVENGAFRKRWHQSHQMTLYSGLAPDIILAYVTWKAVKHYIYTSMRRSLWNNTSRVKTVCTDENATSSVGADQWRKPRLQTGLTHLKAVDWCWPVAYKDCSLCFKGCFSIALSVYQPTQVYW